MPSAVLGAAIVTEAHPRTAISATFQVVNDDGSLLAALICCAYLCLVDAAVPLRGAFAAASCGLRSAGAVSAVVDLTSAEERDSGAVCTVAVLSSSTENGDSASIGVPFFGLRGAVDIAGMAALRSHGIDAALVMQRIMAAAVAAKLTRLQY